MISSHHTTRLNIKNPKDFVSSITEAYGLKEGFAVIHNCAPMLEKKKIFVCLEPVANLRLQEDRDTLITPDTLLSAKPLEKLRDLQSKLASSKICMDVPTLAGFFAYEFLRHIEKVEVPKHAYFSLPEYNFYLYRKVIEVWIDSPEETTLHDIDYEDFNSALWVSDVTTLEQLGHKDYSTMIDTAIDISLAKYSNFSQSDYEQRVLDIREEIAAGNVYQVNLSQNFRLPFPASAYIAYLASIEENFQSQGAFFNTTDNRGESLGIVSESPETFFRVNDKIISTAPIKGTIPRTCPSQDQLQIEKLKNSSKNLAELAMIVDLLRNDLGKIACPGSVTVKQHARVQSLRHLYHLVSDIEATLPENLSALDVLIALFPSGSITGAPKISAMQYIAKYERLQRGVYTGSIGYFSPGGGASFSVAIRSATIAGGIFSFHAGGGITYLSSPEDEYEETMVKAQSLLETYKKSVRFQN